MIYSFERVGIVEPAIIITDKMKEALKLLEERTVNAEKTGEAAE